MKYIGIDGCSAGWVVAGIDSHDQLSFEIIQRLEVFEGMDALVVFIDMPLDFAQLTYRPCEVEARLLLGKKRAFIFLTPHKEAVFASSYEAANRLNKKLIGKGLSKQAWNICTKIKEAVAFSTCRGNLNLYESHPELCFYFLNNNKPLLSKKFTLKGIEERLELILSASKEYEHAIKMIIANTKRKDVKMDDVLDATVMAIRACSATIQTVPANNTYTENKIFY